jgi:hypothetical protein
VNVYRLNAAVTESNLEAVANEFLAVLEQGFRQAGGHMTGVPTSEPVAGLPTLSVTGTASTPKGVHVVEQVTVIFDGNTEYYLVCQFTPEHAEEMRQGCTQIFESFKVE